MLALLDFNGTTTEKPEKYDPRHPLVVLVSNNSWCLVIYSAASIAVQAILCLGLRLRLGSSVCVPGVLAW